MVNYSIKELSLLSGIKAHTIRIWEKRYNVFSPNRTNTNIRRYSEDDLKLALNISLLLTMGYKISRIAKMSDEEIKNTVKDGNKYIKPPSIPESFFVSAMKLDNAEFSGKLDETIEEKGLEWTFENLLVPFQRRMGVLWQAGTILPAQEHFASNIIRDKLITYSDKLPKPAKDASKILFFLPEGDLHELGILYFSYLAKSKGFDTIYLGQGVPLNDIITLGSKEKINAFFVSIIKSMPEGEIEQLFKQLIDAFPKALIMATGFQIENSIDVISEKVHKISSAKTLYAIIDKIKR